MVSFLVSLRIVSGSPENRTQRHVVISRVWATSPRLPRVGMAGFEPAISCSQRPCCARCPAGRPLPYIPSSFPVRTGGFKPRAPTEGWSSWSPTRRDNPSFATFWQQRLMRESNPPLRLKGRDPQTDRRMSRLGAVCSAVALPCSRAPSTQWAGRARIRVSWFSARRYTISATDPFLPPKQQKNPAAL